MPVPPRSHQQEIEELRLRLEEAEQTLRAIRSGEVDSLVVEGPDGPRVYALEGANNSYRVLVEAMNEGAATLTKDGVVLYCNHRFAEMLSLPLEKVIGGVLRDHVSSDQLEAFDALVRKSWLEAGRAEIALRRADGTLFRVLVSLRALVDGDPVLCLIAADLTEQLRAQELRESEARAVSRAAEFEALLNAVPAAVLIASDRHATRIYGNSVTYDLLRLPQGAEVSKTGPLPPMNFRLMKDGVELPPNELPVHMAAKQGVEVRSCEMDLVFTDGTVRHILGNATPLLDHQGRPSGAVGAYVDITERRRAEEALKEADHQKNEFLGVLSHELRNPLGPILNGLYILDRTRPDSNQALRAKQVIARQVGHLSSLVDDLLDVTGSPTARSSFIVHASSSGNWFAVRLRTTRTSLPLGTWRSRSGSISDWAASTAMPDALRRWSVTSSRTQSSSPTLRAMSRWPLSATVHPSRSASRTTAWGSTRSSCLTSSNRSGKPTAP